MTSGIFGAGPDPTRRRFLADVAALAAFPVLGRASVPAPPDDSGCTPRGQTPLELPIVGRPRPPRVCIDAHAHFFNATDIQVAGYLAGPIAHGSPRWERELLKAAAPILEWIGHTFPPTANEELRDLCSRTGSAAFQSLADPAGAVRRSLEAERIDYRRRLSTRLQEAFEREPLFRQRYENQLRRYFDARRLSLERRGMTGGPLSLVPPSDPLDAAEVFRALSSGATPRNPALQWMDQDLAPDARSPEGVIAFLGFMLSPRHHNLLQYEHSFASDPDAFGIDACIGALVDFDLWLGMKPTPSSMREQVLLHEQLAVLSGGYMLPLVAYNPWVDIEHPQVSLEILDWAVNEHGCVGAKIYPPVGYLPAGNAKLPHGALSPRPDNEALDAVLARFYRKCLDLDIVVMAHSSESMGRDGDHDPLGGPVGWQNALRLPGIAGLRVNAGHFGGDSEKPDQPPSQWTRRFADVMGLAEASRLYADLGYWTDLGDRTADAQARLREVATMPLPNNQQVADRIMFGTDWFMMSKEPDWANFPGQVAGFLDGLTGVPDFVERAFYRNAARCFGIGRSGEYRGRNRDRLEKFYERWKMPPPKWMTKLDAVL